MSEFEGPQGPAPSVRGFSADVIDDGVLVSVHALDRVREHHPAADDSHVRRLLKQATELPLDACRRVGVGRRANGDRVLAVADRRGAFVIGSNDRCRCRWVVKTYLRFDDYQRQQVGAFLSQPLGGAVGALALLRSAADGGPAQSASPRRGGFAQGVALVTGGSR